MRAIIVLLLLTYILPVSAQKMETNLTNSWNKLINDPQLKHAIASFTVLNQSTGKLVFERNGQVGLIPASTQKVLTSIACFELLGPAFRYQTAFGYIGNVLNDSLSGSLFIRGSGDPSFGSSRFNQTKSSEIFNNWMKPLHAKGIKKLSPSFIIDESLFDPVHVPGGWIVDDIGNYYGAGARGFNWRENQYDIVLESGKNVGDTVIIKSINGQSPSRMSIVNLLKTAKKGSGDNAYIYLPLNGSTYYLKGTIPVEEKNFNISGAFVNPVNEFLDSFALLLKDANILDQRVIPGFTSTRKTTGTETVLAIHYSPVFDSLNNYFLKKSINLYGEAFIKTIALIKNGFASTEAGLDIVKKFYQKIGIEPEAISIIDGSGLSPQNRVTSRALTTALQYARGQTWFPYFYSALPVYNDMKMKSGYIDGVRAFCGYHQSKQGVQYCYSIMVNNFSGSSVDITKKIYKLLDNLK